MGPSAAPKSGPRRKWRALVVGVQGNLAERFKQRVDYYQDGQADYEAIFDDTLVATQVDMLDRAEDGRKQARGMFEITVDESMVNHYKNMHGGCIVTLIDLCTSLTLIAASDIMHVSQVLNTVFHAPAPLGAKLRIVAETMSLGRRALSVRCEIWDVTNSRLAATGVHVKMAPSPAKL